MKFAVLVLSTLTCTAASTAFADPVTAPPSAQDSTYQGCQRFDADESYETTTTDPKVIATVRLTGASIPLPFIDNDTPQNRDACILLALQHGANPNGNGGTDLNSPLIQSILNKDVIAFDALMQAKVNTAVVDTSTVGVTATPITALNRACEMDNTHMILALINAGADPVASEPLWAAAAAGDDVAVQALLKTGKIPINQISNIGDSDPETALDPSEVRLDKLNTYFKQFPVGQTANIADKKDYIQNQILPLYTVFTGGSIYTLTDGADPDAFVRGLQTKQSNVSSSLKAAGWFCKQDNCGVLDPDMTAAQLSQPDTSNP